MPRYIVTVEYDAGEYWISFPGIQKAGSHAKHPEDIVSRARSFLDRWAQNGAPLPASLDDAITNLNEPFQGTKLVIFEWDAPAEYRSIHVGGGNRGGDQPHPPRGAAMTLLAAEGIQVSHNCDRTR